MRWRREQVRSEGLKETHPAEARVRPESDSLLERMLKLLRAGGLHTVSEVARQLSVSESLVLAMADNLARRGYLMPLDGECTSGCGTCPMTAACHMPGSEPSHAPLLALTLKGRQAVKGHT